MHSFMMQEGLLRRLVHDGVFTERTAPDNHVYCWNTSAAHTTDWWISGFRMRRTVPEEGCTWFLIMPASPDRIDFVLDDEVVTDDGICVSLDYETKEIAVGRSHRH